MKVKELINFLQKMPQDATVLLSSDEEGNSYSPVDIENCGYASGNFDTDEYPECFTNDMYNMRQDEMHGDYIILYPR